MLNSCARRSRSETVSGSQGEPREHTMDIIPDRAPVCQFFFAVSAENDAYSGTFCGVPLHMDVYFFCVSGLDFCCCSRSSTMMEFDSIKPFGVSRQRPETFLQRSCFESF